ncbi:MAG: helix-turn-helix transcriptional regulator [Bacteroidota bacterium]
MYKEDEIPFYQNINEAFIKTRNIETHPHFDIINYERITHTINLQTQPFRLNAYLVCLVTDGEYRFMIDEREYTFKRGTLFFLSPWHTRSYLINKAWKGYLTAFTPHFLSQFSGGTDINNFAFFAPGKSVVLSLSDEQIDELTILLKQMETENNQLDEHKHQLLFHYTHILLHKCEHILHQTGTDTILANDDVLNRFYGCVHDYFTGLTGNNTAQPLTINIIADRMHLHPHYLSDIIKQKTGRTATQLIRERTAHEAQRLLLHTNKSISQIAYHLRFDDNSNFTKFFKSQLQVTPKEFRERNLKASAQ